MPPLVMIASDTLCSFMEVSRKNFTLLPLVLWLALDWDDGSRLDSGMGLTPSVT